MVLHTLSNRRCVIFLLVKTQSRQTFARISYRVFLFPLQILLYFYFSVIGLKGMPNFGKKTVAIKLVSSTGWQGLT